MVVTDKRSDEWCLSVRVIALRFCKFGQNLLTDE